MPIYQQIDTPHFQVMIWKYDDADSLVPELLIEPENRKKIEAYHHKKLKEYLIVRHMLKLRFPKCKILYDALGQPFLSPDEARISISHSFPYAALAISKKSIGLDLEKISDRMLNVKDKFLTDYEKYWLSGDYKTEMLTAIWCIKEALYKIHPSKLWSFRTHYEVQPFTEDNFSAIECRVFSADFQDFYKAEIHKIDDYYLSIVY